MKSRLDLFALTFRLPILVWQALFFVGPLAFMVAMSFFDVKNYRMVETFQLGAWERMLTRGYVWDSYFLTLGRAALAAVAASLAAFPAAWLLAFRASEAQRRWAISWLVILAESGVVNAGLAKIGLGPFTMLNTGFGTQVGYLTLVLPLVLILQTVTLANIDPRLPAAARNLGCPPARVIREVVLPLAKTGLVVAALFAFILAFGDFVAPYYLGGSKPPTLPILIIDTTKSGQQWPRAAVVAVMMMLTLFAIAFAAIAFAYRKRASR